MNLHVLAVAALVTVQDTGRPGYRHLGVPVGGALDGWALTALNTVVGNPPQAAGLEVGAGEVTVLADDDALLAWGGPWATWHINGVARPPWVAHFVRRGWEVRLQVAGGWGYLAVAGGLCTPIVLGARATDVRLGWGQVVTSGTSLPVGATHLNVLVYAGNTVLTRPPYTLHPTLRLHPGPQWAHFSADNLSTFIHSFYRVLPSSDRMGWRLHGESLHFQQSADILSEGMVFGAVQVPASGQPLIMLADAPPTGGYAKVGCVAQADWPLLAQLTPESQVRFQWLNAP